MKKFTCLLLFSILLSNVHSQIIATFAGNGVAGYSGDGGPATAAEINAPSGVGYDASGNVYIADTPNSRIRKVNSSGIISTFCGNGVAGYSGDGGPATSAEINAPHGIAVDVLGNIYFADGSNNRIRKVSTSGIVTTFAGNGAAGFSGNGGQATAAELQNPTEITFDGSGNAYIADYTNQRIRKVTTSGVISTFAGNGTIGFSGNGGQATAAEFDNPSDVYVDGSGNTFVVDKNNARIRKINTSGVISTYAGKGVAGYSGDGGQATDAEINTPAGVREDANGNVYIGDYSNSRMRIINAGIINTFAGDGVAGYSGDGGEASTAELDGPGMMTFDNRGNLYFTDKVNNRIREVYLSLNVTTTITANVTCNGGSNGSASVSAINGTTPYTYSWSSGASGSSQTGLSAGTYYITATDADGVTGSTSVTITQPFALDDSLVSIVYPDDSGNLGSATIGVKYGTPPYTYSWSPNTDYTATATGLSAGSYTLTITDANECTSIVNVSTTNISFPTQPRWAKRGLYVYLLDDIFGDATTYGIDFLNANPGFAGDLATYCTNNHITYVVIFELTEDEISGVTSTGWVFGNHGSNVGVVQNQSTLESLVSTLKGAGVEEVGIGYQWPSNTPPYSMSDPPSFQSIEVYNENQSITQKVDIISLDEEWWIDGSNFYDYHLPLIESMQSAAQDCNCYCNGPNLRVEDFFSWVDATATTTTEMQDISEYCDRIQFAEYVTTLLSNPKNYDPYLGIWDANIGDWPPFFSTIGAYTTNNPFEKEIWPGFCAENDNDNTCPTCSPGYDAGDCSGYDICEEFGNETHGEYIENLSYNNTKAYYNTEYNASDNKFQILGSTWYEYHCMSPGQQNLTFSNPASTYLPFYVTVGPDQYATGSALPVTADVSELSPTPPYTYTWYDMNTGTILSSVKTSSTSNTYTLPYNTSNNSYPSSKLGVVVQDNGSPALVATDYLCIYGQYPGPLATLGPISASNPCLCTGGSTTLTETPIPGFSYSWAPSTFLNTTTGTSVTSTPTVTTTYTVTATDTYSTCSLSLTNSITVHVGVPETPTITVSGLIEPGYDASCHEPADLSANSPCAASYNWGIYSETGSWTLGSSTTSSNYVTASTLSTNVTVYAEGVNTCGTSSPGYASVYSGTTGECMGNAPIKRDSSSSTKVYSSANGQLTIEIMPGSGAQSLQAIDNYFYLYDALGQLIEKNILTNSLTTIPVSNLSSGMYFYRLVNQEQELIKSDKLLIIH